MVLEYDVMVIGAGVVGCAIARELSRFRLAVGVLDKEPDVGLGTSCRNSGVLHSGIHYQPGTLRARLSVRGNAMMDKLCQDLKVPLRRIGKLTVALDHEDIPALDALRRQGEANGVPGTALLDNAGMRRIQPGVRGVCGLWTPSSGIVSPYGLAIALAENAHANGVDFHLGHTVDAIRRLEDGGFAIEAAVCRRPGRRSSGRAAFTARVVVNAAGLRADAVDGLAGLDSPRVWACRGEYHVLDKRLAGSLATLVYPVPGPRDPGLGIHLTPTVDGNILVGPSAAYIPDEDRESYRTTSRIMDELGREGGRLLPGVRASDCIRSFAGNRPKLTPPEAGGNADFVIEETPLAGFIHLLGIESPGLTSSPAIAEMVRERIAGRLPLVVRTDFRPERPGFAGSFAELPLDTRMAMIRNEPEYGEVVCRCEQVTKHEIRRAIENPLGAWSLAAVKYRTRAMMGRCQGGFCLPRIVAILRNEYGYETDELLMRGGGSTLVAGKARP